MVYAITGAVTLFFLIIYFLTRQKPREVYSKSMNEEEFIKAAKLFARKINIPIECGNLNDKQIKRKIKYLSFILNRKKYKNIFDDFCQKPNILKSVLKVDFSELANLPFSTDKPRAVELAKFMLANSKYIFTQDRFSVIANEFNRIHTLAYAEVSHMKEAFLYVLLEKISFIFLNLQAIAKTMNVAKKYAEDNGNIFFDKRYKSFSTSKLFLDLCAIESGYKQSIDAISLKETLDNLYLEYSRVLYSMECVVNFDFSKYYTPLEILDKYSSFSMASPTQKDNFLKLFATLSDKENIDEFMYAIRLDKYMQTSSSKNTRVNRVISKSFSICILKRNNDMSLLQAALSSDFLMRVFFGKKRGIKSNSILKIADFENTFEPVYKFENLNFGISTSNDILQINPHLPRQILRADVEFKNKDTTHQIHIIRSYKSGMFIGSTEIKGTHYIKLSDKPLDITVEIDN